MASDLALLNLATMVYNMCMPVGMTVVAVAVVVAFAVDSCWFDLASIGFDLSRMLSAAVVAGAWVRVCAIVVH